MLLPVWPKFVDLQGSVLYGQGIGRYGSSQLADVVIGPNGSLTPITSLQFMVGAVIHPFAGNDIYAYYGQDQTRANPWTVGGVQGGWGNGAFPNACGVLVPGSTDSVGFNASGAPVQPTSNAFRNLPSVSGRTFIKAISAVPASVLNMNTCNSVCSPAQPVLSLEPAE